MNFELVRMQHVYDTNKVIPVGAFMKCACCESDVVKKSRHMQFCTAKGKKSCKDVFWARVNTK